MLSLNEGEQQLLSTHLAHTHKVHNQFYKQQEATLSLAKVSRVLCAVESGKVSDFANKSLDDINVTG